MNEACILPDGRRLGIAPEIADRLSCAVVVLVDARPGPGEAVQEEIGVLGAKLQEEHGDLEPSRIPGLTEARTLYKSFGMDPSRHRPSSEALLRRILKGKGLYTISNLVDVCNLASLEFLLPIGMYDLAHVVGDVTLRVGAPDEEYAGIRKGMVHLAGRLGLFDEISGFGSPTSDSARTCTSASTREILAVIMATAAYSAADLAAHATRFGALFGTYCGARVATTAVLGRGTS